MSKILCESTQIIHKKYIIKRNQNHFLSKYFSPTSYGGSGICNFDFLPKSKLNCAFMKFNIHEFYSKKDAEIAVKEIKKLSGAKDKFEILKINFIEHRIVEIL